MPPRLRVLRWLTFISLALAAPVQAAPLSFAAALDLAEQRSADLAAQQARIEAARSLTISADALPDPKLFVGIDNLPVSGADRFNPNRDFMTMQKIGVMQDVPNSDKRHARAEVAARAVGVAEADRRFERSKVRSEAAQAWLTRYYLEKRLALFAELEHENELFVSAVRAQIAGGRGQVADAVAPKQEAAQLADREDELKRDLAKSKSALRRFLGIDAEEPLAGEPPALVIDPDSYRRHIQHHPEIEAFGRAGEKAEAEVREAIAGKRPDWGVSAAYQRRAPPYSDMVSVQFTFDLPLFSKTRQDPQIAAKQKQVDEIDAQREAMLRSHTAELENNLADYASVSSQLNRARGIWVPLAREKIDLQMASYRAGKSDLAAVLATRRELVEQRLKTIDLEQKREETISKLYFNYGESIE